MNKESAYTIGRYLITYFFTNRWNETSEICSEHFHPINKAELVRFAMIKCDIYNFTYTTKKVENI